MNKKDDKPRKQWFKVKHQKFQKLWLSLPEGVGGGAISNPFFEPFKVGDSVGGGSSWNSIKFTKRRTFNWTSWQKFLQFSTLNLTCSFWNPWSGISKVGGVKGSPRDVVGGGGSI